MDELKNHLPPGINGAPLNGDYNPFANLNYEDRLNFPQSINFHHVDAKEIRENARLLVAHKIKICDENLEWTRIPTNCSTIDKTLKGGIPVKGITEIYGSSGVGKTQLCMQLCLNIQLVSRRGAVYICTEDVFPVKRLKELVNSLPVRNLHLMDHIFIEHISRFVKLTPKLKKYIHNVLFLQEQLKQLFKKLPVLLSAAKIGLLIIDSIAGIFRSDDEMTDYKSRSKIFDYIGLQLQQFTSDYDLATVCVNQVTDNVQNGQTEPCLGLAWARLVMHRFKISRPNRGELRVFEVISSPDLPREKCHFRIQKSGLVPFAK